MPPATFKDLALDAVDPLRLGRFWAAALGLAREERDARDTRLRGPAPPPPGGVPPLDYRAPGEDHERSWSSAVRQERYPSCAT